MPCPRAAGLNRGMGAIPSEPRSVSRTGKRGITRRQALVAAAVTGVGVGAVRLLGGSMQQLSAGRVAPANQWPSPLGSESARVMNLLRRTTLGYTEAQLERALSDGFDRTVTRFLDTPPAEPAALDLATTPGGRFATPELQRWWIDHMLATPTPFAERMTLFWHGHFTSDYRKTADNTFMYWQNLTWRRMSLTDLRSMLMRVTADPAMLRYLDLATSTGTSPNENYSRELMELFTMGAGNYTEDDVRAAAKALAGWQLPRPDSFAPLTVGANVTRSLPVYASQKSGVFNARRAFAGTVTYLGKTAYFDAEAVVDRILAQPSTAGFIASKVAQHFVTNQPDAAYVGRLADVFRRARYDIKALMHAVITSPEFSAASSYRALVKSPTEFMVHAARAVAAGNVSGLIALSGAGMGQSLFDPPDVSGWPNNESWISSNTVVERVNFVTRLVAAAPSLPSAANAARTHLDGVLAPQTARLSAQASDDRGRWFVLLASPEFQLK